MATVYDNTDLWVSTDLDIWPDSSTGDIKDTSAEPLRSLKQEIASIALYSPGDWRSFPDIGAGLREYIGQPNTEEVANEMSGDLFDAFIEDRVVDASDLSIEPMPISVEDILFHIEINADSIEPDEPPYTLEIDLATSLRGNVFLVPEG